MVLVIGIGNTLRRDDGAGWLFAQALADELRSAGVEVDLLLQHQLTPELAEFAAERAPQMLVFVDASTAVDDVTLTPLEADRVAAPVSHHLSPAAILAIAQRLYGMNGRGRLVQIAARDLGHGEGLSATAARGLASAPTIAAGILADLGAA